MTRDETIALWRECEDIRLNATNAGKSERDAHEFAKKRWNDWANPLVQRRYELEEENLLRYETVQAKDFIAPRKAPSNAETRSFDHVALVDFTSHVFGETTNFTGFIFPGEVRIGSDPSETHNFVEPAIFEKYVKFDRCMFHGDLRLRRCVFKGNASFTASHAMRDVNFAEVEFRSAAWFRDSEFGNDVWFGQASFGGYCDFINVNFRGHAGFRGITSSGIFSLLGAKFQLIPDFAQANFRESPNLGDFDYPQQSFWKKGDETNIAKFRSLRRLAIQGHDHENEAKAFKNETRAKRGTEHKPWHAAFWIGVLYDAVSDFGRSLMRPFWIWLLSIPTFAAVYLVHAAKLDYTFIACADGNFVWLKTLLFSLKNSVLFVSWDREQIRSAYACLYDQQQNNMELIVPTTNAFIQAAQSVWSAVLIFLFLLAVRNQFKIK